jgi:hypothetical protein
MQVRAVLKLEIIEGENFKFNVLVAKSGGCLR